MQQIYEREFTSVRAPRASAGRVLTGCGSVLANWQQHNSSKFQCQTNVGHWATGLGIG